MELKVARDTGMYDTGRREADGEAHSTLCAAKRAGARCCHRELVIKKLVI